MSDKKIKNKVDEIAKSLSEETGVDIKDVELLLESLNLEGALRHRLFMEAVADENDMQDKIRKLDDVNLDNIRIAGGSIGV